MINDIDKLKKDFDNLKSAVFLEIDVRLNSILERLIVLEQKLDQLEKI